MNRRDIISLAQQDQAAQFSGIIPNQEDKLSGNEDSESLSTKNMIQSLAQDNIQKEANKFGFLDTIKDIGQQAISKGISGVAGAFGNVLDTFGLQTKKGQEILPGQKDLHSIQRQILEKMERGEVPSANELMLLSDDEIAPNYTRLPTSKDIQEGIQGITGIAEGKTPAGRIAGNAAQFAGEGLGLGGAGKALATLAGAGTLGQSLRETGVNEGIASAAEIVGSIAPSAITRKLSPGSKATKEIVEAGRKLGLTEKQITPLIQGEGKVNLFSKLARKGKKTKELFTSIKEALGDSYERIKSHPKASEFLPYREQKALTQEFSNIRSGLTKTLAPSPDKEAAIKYVDTALETLRNKGATPEHLVNFWQDINKSVKWNSIQGGKKALAQLKDPVLNTLKNVSPELAENFEITNKLYSKYAQVSKKLKPELVDSFVNKAELLTGLPAIMGLATGNPTIAIGLGSEAALRILSREMLINPMFQNVAGKLVKNINQGSVKAAMESVERVKKYLQKKHPNEDWSFLTNPEED